MSDNKRNNKQYLNTIKNKKKHNVNNNSIINLRSSMMRQNELKWKRKQEKNKIDKMRKKYKTIQYELITKYYTKKLNLMSVEELYNILFNQ